MLPCDRYQDRLLDHLYGLLEPSEADALEAHLAGCPSCATAREQAARWGGLIASAARFEFPTVRFVPPEEAAVPAGAAGRPTPRNTVHRAWLQWVVAVGLLLGVVGLGGGTARDLAGYIRFKPQVDQQYAALRQANEEKERLTAEYRGAQDRVAKRLTAAEKAHDELLQRWAKDEGQLVAERTARPLTIFLSGPSTAIPGAPNSYAVLVHDRADKPRPAAVEAKVRDAAGRTLFDTTFETDGTAGLKPNDGGRLRNDLSLPASLWERVTPGAELFLTLTATDAATKEKAAVTESFRLLEPVYTTFLATDKPMYRPGETVYFRSLTLDRARFLPPARDLNLTFKLIGPNGLPVSGLALTGRPMPVAPDNFAPVLGPDGKPVRGVGTGAFTLPATLAGGAYTVTVAEGSSAKPLATRQVLVNNYAPDKLEKTLDFDARSYGPGDPVQAKVEVRDQGKPAADVPLKIKVMVDGKEVAPDVAPAKTDAAGNAAVRFTLPKADAIRSATLTVTATTKAGTPEALVRPVPLATRTLHVEFFPEGGDLVLGVPNRVYFRVTTTTVPGKPADVTGILTDGTKTICEVKTLTDAEHPGVNQGLGVFTFTPEPGKRYAVQLSRPVGVIQPTAAPFAAAVGVVAATPLTGYELPPAKADGVVLNVPDGVAEPGDKLRVNLWSVGKKRSVLIGAYTRGRPVAHQRAVLEPGRPTELTLDPGGAKLGGVTRVTVFEEPADAEGRVSLKPVAERLVYRQPGEFLKLRFDATRPGGKPRGGAFAPGEPVELTVHAYDETGRPKPAILWAAVVNQSVLAMADEKTERLMPTHFLLGGEVQNGEELEHADFLLTDHPKAAAGLDLLLGTQGWRRFAEQAPGEFRARHGEQAEAVLVAMGLPAGGGPVWRTDARRVFNEYWPKYEAAVAELDAADKDRRTGESVAATREKLTTAELTYNSRLNAIEQAAPDLLFFYESMESRRPWLPVTLGLAFGGGLVLLAARFVRRREPERAPLMVGAVGLLGLGLFLLFAAWYTGRGDRGWRAYANNTRPIWVQQFPPQPAPQLNQIPAKRVFEGNAGGIKQPIPLRGLPPAPPGVKALPPGEPRGPQPEKVNQPSPLGPRLNSDLFKVRMEAKRGVRKLSDAEQAGLGLIAASPKLPPPMVVREYAHQRPTPTPGATRTDFTETLLWQPVIVLPQDGKATLAFDLSDAVAGYRVLVAGHTLDGRIGAVTGTIEVRKPLAVEPKLPQEVSSADKIDLPVGLTNGTGEPHTAGVALTLDGFAADGPGKFAVKVPANGGGRHLVRLTPTRSEGELAVTVNATAGPGLSDSVRRTTKVVADGFPFEGAKSDLLEQRTEATVRLPKTWTPGTLKVTVTVYPNTLAELQAGLDGLMREPHGCFEQSSTANYPNVLITEYLRQTGRAAPDLSRRARELMDRGYAKLTGYECPKTGSAARCGYEWFGAADRPHEALTAYGLMQFTDMARVYPVDPAMLARTRQYLLDCRDGHGGFTRSGRALDSFGRAPEHITNAYIVWALTEADRGTDLTQEIDALLAQSKGDGPGAKDPYFLALLANALLNRGRQAEAVEVLTTLAEMQAADGSVPGAKTSITNSTGRALAIETTALALLGWQKANRPDRFLGNVQKAVRWVCGHRDGSGVFGSSQSTILALKALIAYAKANGTAAESGQLKVSVGGEVVATREFSGAAPGPVEVEIADAEKRFNPGDTVVRLETTAAKALPMSVAWSCRTERPDSSPECAVRLGTKLARAEVEEGDSVRLTVTVENVRETPQGMTVAIVGLPAGLKLPEDQKQLKGLTAAPAPGAEPAVSYWETRGRELILYWRGLAPQQQVSLGVDLIAAVPGEYRGPASRAYLYYDADHKHWVEPVSVKVRAK
ncbi:MAG TPA: alpha-2-macroglobulin family protein [Fimbriiglobus sp.]|nr:alpha-2-macroglobulin family protein [Fimbriiglobus sp.]